MTNKEKLERLVEAGKKATQGEWDCDERLTPFYNDAEGYSRGGNGTGICDFCILDDTRNPILDENQEIIPLSPHSVKNAVFITQAANSRQAIEEMLSENERLRSVVEDAIIASEWYQENSCEFNEADFEWRERAKQALGESE